MVDLWRWDIRKLLANLCNLFSVIRCLFWVSLRSFVDRDCVEDPVVGCGCFDLVSDTVVSTSVSSPCLILKNNYVGPKKRKRKKNIYMTKPQQNAFISNKALKKINIASCLWTKKRKTEFPKSLQTCITRVNVVITGRSRSGKLCKWY